jgi:hypothetical protein
MLILQVVQQGEDDEHWDEEGATLQPSLQTKPSVYSSRRHSKAAREGMGVEQQQQSSSTSSWRRQLYGEGGALALLSGRQNQAATHQDVFHQRSRRNASAAQHLTPQKNIEDYSADDHHQKYGEEHLQEDEAMSPAHYQAADNRRLGRAGTHGDMPRARPPISSRREVSAAWHHRRQSHAQEVDEPREEPSTTQHQHRRQHSRHEGEKVPLLGAAAGNDHPGSSSTAHASVFTPLTHHAPALELAQVYNPREQAQQATPKPTQPLTTAFINLPAATAASTPVGQGQLSAPVVTTGKLAPGTSPAPAPLPTPKKRTVVAEDDEDKVRGVGTCIHSR